MVKDRFLLKNGNAFEGEEDVDSNLDEDEQIEWDEMFIKTEASKHIQEGDMVVIKIGDDHPYYLLKVASLFETKAETTGDYRHTFPPAHGVVEGNYLESIRKPMMVRCIILITYAQGLDFCILCCWKLSRVTFNSAKET